MTDELTRRDVLGAIGVTAAAAGLPARRLGASERPNILFILGDDLGYGDLSCYGRPDYETPVLDRLAAQGLKFTDAYAAAAVCTPTRCAFATGRYPQRLDVGLQEPLTAATPELGLPPCHPTIASLLKKNRYQTALVGKWHLGGKPELGPNQHGFDEFFGILGGSADYFTHSRRAANGRVIPDLWENVTRVEREGYLTDLLTERAVDFIARPHAEPFYLSLHYNAPHPPWEGPGDAATDHGAHGPGPMTAGGSQKIFAEMMKSMDSGIGRVLEALRRARLERETLVIFTSDNGGERYSYNWPFSFQKAYLWEGGIRVPAIVRWPGVVPANRVTAQAAITMDWTATILAAAGALPDPSYPLDGEDLMPVCTGERDVYDRALFWRTRTRAAARIGNWKYVSDSDVEHLFDLNVDLGEKAELRDRRADTFAAVKSRYEGWAEQMLPRPSAPQAPE